LERSCVVYACLSGFRVLEYSQMVAGPYCGKLLAELGAEVLKVESPTGDRARQEGPFVGDAQHAERSCLYLYLNAGKLGITLDLKSPGGRCIFEQLAGSTDVLIEDTTPGTLEALGLGYDRLSQLNPRLVVTSITPFGQTGPYRHYKAYHLNVYHASGDGYLLPSAGETLDRPPMTGGGHLGDYEAGLSASVATVAALLASRLRRRGQHVDVSKQEALLALNRDSACRCASEEREETRFSRRYAYGGMVPCKDGYIVAQVQENHHWEMLTRLMGDPALAADPRFATHQARGRHGDEINRLLAEWARRHTKKEIYQQALEMGCPIGLVATPEEVVNSPHAAARGLFHEVYHPAIGAGKYAGLPFILKDREDGCPRPAPSLGEHNRLVFCERLGYTEQELELLSQTGAL
jgi:crotonobetainyl-CoA:carnitine CoA-transferase CaiB-like acyl-CoA transferase